MTTDVSYDPEQLKLAQGHFIANETVIEGSAAPVLRASDLQSAGFLPEASAATVDQAVQSARAAFAGWRAMPPRQRAALLQRWADLVQADAQNLARIEAATSSRPIAEAVVRDVVACVATLRFYAEWADKLEGSVTASGPGMLNLALREPHGVVAAIVPWNFPLLLATWKLAPALAAGNTVVLKPSELTPFSALRLAELSAQAGLPAGVFNVVHGGGATGEALVNHPEVNFISFTGSSATGARIAHAAADRHVEVALELGGKSPQVVFSDAGDLGSLADLLVASFCRNAGQICFAGTRLVVERSIKAQLLELIVARVAKLRAGKTWDASTTLPPVISEKQWMRIDSLVRASREEGVELVTGGAPWKDGGCFYPPTVLDRVETTHTAFLEEFFGPVLAVQAFDDEDEALALAQHPMYALAAGVHTRDIDRALRLAQRIDAGTVWVNQYGLGDLTTPFGGFKHSGHGKDQGRHGVEKYFRTKAVSVKFSI